MKHKRYNVMLMDFRGSTYAFAFAGNAVWLQPSVKRTHVMPLRCLYFRISITTSLSANSTDSSTGH